MAGDVKQNIHTTYKLTDFASKPLAGIGRGLANVSTRTLGVMNSMRSLPAVFGAIAVGGMAKKVMDMQGEWETMQIGLAQTLRFMGESTGPFEGSMSRAAGVMRDIEAAAAALPGETEHYAAAMQVAGTIVSRATGDYKASFDLVKKTTAISLALGNSARMGGVMLNRMLNAQQGMFRMNSDAAIKFMTAMQQLPGYASLTTREFNKMDLQERLKIVTATMGQFDGMLGQFEKSWDAVKGTTTSTIKALTRGATAPLFDSAKNALFSMNAALVGANGSLTEAGQRVVSVGASISSSIVSALRVATDSVGAFKDALSQKFRVDILMALGRDTSGDPIGSAPDGGGGILGGAAGAVGALAAARAFGNFTPLTAAVSLAVGGLVSFFTHTEAVARTASYLSGALTSVVSFFETLGVAIGTVSNALGVVFAGALPGIARVLESWVNYLVSVWGGFFDGFMDQLTAVTPLFEDLGDVLSLLYNQVADTIDSMGFATSTMSNAFELLGVVVADAGIGLVTVFTGVVLSALALVTAFDNIISAVGHVINYVKDTLGFTPGMDKTEGGSTDPSASTQYALPPMMQSNALAVRQTNKLGVQPNGGGGGGGGRTSKKADVYQDFRYSRFDIAQAFENGFDPDRVALAFSKDVVKLGEHRLSSGFEPMFGLT